MGEEVFGLLEGATAAREGALAKLIEELTGCHDSREVLLVSTQCLQKWFPTHSFYGLLLSDPTGHSWRFLKLKNPGTECPNAVPVAELPTDEPIDPIMIEHGTDVSATVVHDPRVMDLLAGDQEEFAMTDEPDLERIQRSLAIEARTLFAARWQRPRGGLGWIFIGFDEPLIPAHEDLKFFATVARVTARMAIYPEMVHEVARSERIGMSLRRNIVHDLKTPLTVIRGFAQTLMLPGVVDDPKTQRELLAGIVEQTDRLLDDLKDILVPLDDAWRPQPEEFDLALVLQQAVIAERHTERAKNHRIQVEGANDKCLVYVDRRKIRRVIENLVSNAVKYSPGLGKTVTVSLKTQKDEVHIGFADEGIGMTPTQLDHVIKEGGRAADKSLGIEGTGFGLDSCSKVLDAHGGRLDARSELGKGSNFTAVFPTRLKI